VGERLRHGWSIDSNVWNDLQESERRWRAVRLTPADKNVVPKESGIYMICAAPPGYMAPRRKAGDLFKNLYSPIYIGKSKDLQERFFTHCTKPKVELEESQICFKGNLDFWFMRLDEDKIDQFEASLIDCFGPPANRISGIRARIQKGEPA
jgi:hypothetical protein